MVDYYVTYVTIVIMDRRKVLRIKFALDGAKRRK